jgi:hypothetical protein
MIVVMPSVIMTIDVTLSCIMLMVNMLNVVMSNVMAPSSEYLQRAPAKRWAIEFPTIEFVMATQLSA